MKTSLLSKKVLGIVFGLSLLLGTGIAASSEVQAQWQYPQYPQTREEIRQQRQWEREQRRRQREAQRQARRSGYGYGTYGNYGTYGTYDNLPYYGGSQELRQTALNAGYNEGIKEGRKDRNNGDRYEYQDESDYRNANTDYSSRLGDRELYRQYFRQGFVNGYTDGYRGY